MKLNLTRAKSQLRLLGFRLRRLSVSGGAPAFQIPERVPHVPEDHQSRLRDAGSFPRGRQGPHQETTGTQAGRPIRRSEA